MSAYVSLLGFGRPIKTIISSFAFALSATIFSMMLSDLRAEPGSSAISPAAQVETPPSAAKLHLIHRFMELTGLQRRVDSGSFLERHAFPRGAMWEPAHTDTRSLESFQDAVERRIAALREAYAPHRDTYLREYESHINWEFTEEELAEIVAFLERPVGQHYLDGDWRMNAYVGTNVAELEQQIVQEAISSLHD